MKSPTAHYARLFDRLARENGEIHNDAITGIVGFSAGGPDSMCQVGEERGYVTVELSLFEEQKVSAEGIRFELLSRSGLSSETTHAILTAIGNLSMNAMLGNGHTIDLTQVVQSPDVRQVRLQLYSKAGLLWSKYGVYEVVLVQ